MIKKFKNKIFIDTVQIFNLNDISLLVRKDCFCFSTVLSLTVTKHNFLRLILPYTIINNNKYDLISTTLKILKAAELV